MRILAISGSLRSGSTNLAFLLAAKDLGQSLAEVSLFQGMEDIPFFNPDFDKDPLPKSVSHLREEIAKADAILISTPEYAHGVPGVLKNLLDWLVSAPIIIGKPVGLLFASASDASFAREALVEVLKTMSLVVVPGASLNVRGARTKIAPDGKILDPNLAKELKSVLENLKNFDPASTNSQSL